MKLTIPRWFSRRVDESRVDFHVGDGVSVQGDITSRGNILIEGRVLGNIEMTDDKHAITIESGGSLVINELYADILIVRGELHVKQLHVNQLRIEGSAVVKAGSIDAQSISVNSTSILEGMILPRKAPAT